jgi:N4-gp56 family major capsid protein
VANINYSTTNFDKTVTALVKEEVKNIRRNLRYLQPGAYEDGELIPGTNLIRHVSYGDLSIVAPAQSDGTPPWLAEGTTPTALALGISYDEFAVNQIGKVVEITDRALKYNPHNLMAKAAERIAWDAMATTDAIVASVVQAITATTTNGHAAAALTTSDYLTSALVRLQVAALRATGIPPVFGTDYGAMVHPYAIYDLMGDSAWQDVAKYASPENMLSGEVGRLYGVRFIETTVGTWVNNTGGVGSNIPVYSTLFFGANYFAFGDFGSIETYMVTGPDKSDPLNQLAKVGYKGYIGADVSTTLGTRARRLVHAGSVAGAASI